MKKTRLSSRIWSVALCLCMVLSLMPGIPLVAKAAGTEGMITIEMTDSYGDGWNGNAIEIYVDGELLDTATIDSGSSNTWTTQFESHATYIFKWVNGSYADETSFVIYVGTEERLSDNGDGYRTGDELWTEAPACTEPVYENGVCTNCGAVCVHQLNDAGLCSVCGYQCSSHSFSDGVCGICGGVCSHSVMSGSVCSLCGQTVNLTIDMTANYSYGWDQCAQITVFADGTEIGVAELVNERSGSWSVPYDSMTTYTFHWTPESWPWECTFTIKIGDTEYYAADNDACDDLAEGVFFTIESRCPHDSFDEDYICTICGKSCGHKAWTDSVCGVCGFVCGTDGDHAWSKGACAVCGAVCPHERYEAGLCTNCGYYEPAVQNGTGDNGFALYEIYNASQLLWFADYVNSGEILKTHTYYDLEERYTYYTTGCVNAKLMADIDMTGLPWNPIGRNDIEYNLYTGVFDGNGHTVSGIDCTVTSDDDTYAGFFGEFSGTVKNLTVQGSFKGVTTATDRNVYAGGIAGYCEKSSFDIDYDYVEDVYPVIENCTFIGSVSAEANNMVIAGGIAGYSHSGTMTNCLAAATVTSNEASYVYAGALVGSANYSTFTNCYYDSTLCALDACKDGALEGVTGVSTKVMAGGSVAYKLGFGQTLGTDAYPTYGDDPVYPVTTGCATYSNTQTEPTEKTHVGTATCTAAAVCEDCGESFGEALGHGEYDADGKCTLCGEYEMPKQNGTGANGFALYEIENASQLLWFANYVNSGEILKTHTWYDEGEAYYTYYTTNCVNAKLMADIDMTGLLWNPIGRYDIDRNYYTGVFDGNGHTVSGIDCAVTSDDYTCVGFFGEFSGTVKNLTVQGSFKGVTTATNKDVYAGGIVAYGDSSGFVLSVETDDYAYPVIENCTFIGSVSGEANNTVTAGGIAGYFYSGTMTNCLAAATVTSNEASYVRVGALVGSANYSTFTNCYYDSTLCSLDACKDGALEGVTGLATGAFADGSVAYALGFGQTLGTDTYPTYGDDAVYQILNCKNEASYSNTNEASGHKWKDGICSVCYEQCSHIGGEATCTEHAVCKICGASYGELLEHEVSASGVCIQCGTVFPFRVDEADKYFATINEACTYAVSNMSSYTITVLSDAQVDVAAVDKLVINPGVTLTVNDELTVSGLKKDGNVAGDGVVIVGDTEYKIFENDLYRYAGAVDADWEIWNVEFPTYWTAGEGYAAFNPDTQVLTLHNATIYAESYSSDDGAVVYRQDLTINFSGTNTLTTNDHNNGTVLYCEGKTVMNGIGQDAVLNLYSGYRTNDNNGEVRAVRITDLTVNSGTVNVVSGNGIGTVAISGTTLTVAKGAVVNAISGNGLNSISTGVLVQKLTVEGTINGLCMAFAEYVSKINYIACGNATLNHDHILYVFNGAPSTFTVPEGATLTIAEGVTLDLTAATEIDFSGTVVNNGTIILPASYDINNAPKSGIVVIGDNRFTWNGQKWVCADESQHIGGQANCSELAICELCGEPYGDYDSYSHAGETYVEYEWYPYSDGSCYVYATLYCADCDGYIDSNSDYAEQTGTVEATDCLNPGSKTYSVTVTLNGEEYSDTKTYPLLSENHVGEPVNGFCSACGGYEAAVWNEEKAVYEISNAGQLYWYAQYLNTTNAEVYAELTADIIIPENAPNWEPINASYVYFNGNFHTISGLKCIGDENMTYVGLFGCEGWWYEISNLHITNSYFEGSQYVGAVVACMTNGGSVTNCAVTDTTVKGDYYAVGGLIGNLSSSHAINCFSTATVIGGEGNVLIGSHSVGYGSIENCYFLGTEDNYDGTTAMTAEDFASGKVAYLLQSAIQGEDIYDEETGEWIGTAEPELIWGQTIGEDSFPIFGGDKVYQITDCDGKTGYRNVNVSGHIFKDATCTNPKTCKLCGETEGEALPHQFDENGFCIFINDGNICDAYEPAELVEGVYQISNAGQLYWFAQQVNSGKVAINGKLMANIVVNEGTMTAETTGARAWTPIGNNSTTYQGTFDGDGKTVSGLYFNDDSADFVGLFGCVGSGTVKYVGVIDSYICGKYHVGGVAGCNIGTVENCYNTGTVNGTQYVGGVVGDNNGTVENCYNTGTVSGTSYVGGVVGDNWKNVTDCYNTGTVSGTSYVGGVVGENYGGRVENCYYLADSENDAINGTTAKTADRFTSGEVAYLLGTGWGQTIGEDAYPTLGGTAVYKVKDCDGESDAYSNTNVNKNHIPNADDGDCTTNVTCSVCGQVTRPGNAEHSWQDAACTAPRTCSICGTEGDALGHGHTEGISYEEGDGTHDVFCYDCFTTIEWNVQCTYGDNFRCVCSNVCPDGIFEASNGDLYYVENGAAVENKGLVQVVENGLIVYYYFGCGIEGCSAGEACQGNFKAQRSSRHYVNFTNGYLVEGGYTFNADGTIEHFENRQGIQTIDGTKFYLIDGVKVAAGLVEIDGEFYYVRSSGALVIGQDYYVSKPNGLMHNGEEIKKGTYTFDDQGRIDWTLKNGIYAEDGSLYYYVDDVRTYAGLILYTGDIINEDGSVTAGVYNNSMIYVNTHGEVKNNCTYWISKNNGLIEKNRAFTFDANGIVVVVEEKDGFCFENGNWYYYVDGKLNYAGLIWCDGPEGNDSGYYYVNSKGILITDCTYWISKNNGLMQNQAYTFGENGKMVQKTNASDKLLSGIVEENGELYYYENGVKTYAGLIVVDGNYYYANSQGQIVRNGQYWISRTNGLLKPGSYTFDGDGVLIFG